MGTAIKHPVPDRVPERQSARMSKITNDGLTQSGTGCFSHMIKQGFPPLAGPLYSTPWFRVL